MGKVSGIMQGMQTARVFFHPLSEKSGLEERVRATEAILELSDFQAAIAGRDKVAVKLHVGEENNDTHIGPRIVRSVVERIKARGGFPFLTETSTLYRGQRSDAIRHLAHAFAHGFTFEATGAPFVMADGLSGSTEIEVPIRGKIYDRVAVAREAVVADALVALSHPTGHMSSGLGACIKNLGMGLASRIGKLRQHSSIKPVINRKACTLCMKWCPQDAIQEKEGKAFIVQESCIGCGECLAVCRFDAVKYNWGTESAELQRRMAEHALGVLAGKEGKFFNLSFLTDMTRDCDCLNQKQEPILPDLGILASSDPVAVDQAALDLTRERCGRSLAEAGWPELDPTVQLEHAEKIGMGSRRYQLERVGGGR